MRQKAYLGSIFCRLALGTLIFIASPEVFPCSWFKITNKFGNGFIGRTMEWPGDLNGEVTLVPRDYDLGRTRGRYGFIGISHGKIFSDGFNEKGLAVSAMWFRDGKMVERPAAKLFNTDIITSVLSQAETVNDAIDIITRNRFKVRSSDLIDGSEFNLHFAITEQSGRSIVVELIDRNIYVMDNTIGVLTDWPRFNRSLDYSAGVKIPDKNGNEFLEKFDYSYTGRFNIMVSALANNSELSSDRQTVERALSVISAVAVPKNGLGESSNARLIDSTSYAVVVDLKNKHYFIRGSESQTVLRVDLNRIDFSRVPMAHSVLRENAEFRDVVFN